MSDEQVEYYLVGTYGTLKRGKVNQPWMDSANGQFIEEFETVDSKFSMYDYNREYPIVVPNGRSKFSGETFAVPRDGIPILNMLEGYPILYGRMLIKVKGKTTGKVYDVLVYYMTEKTFKDDRGYNYNPIKTQDESPVINVENNVCTWIGN